MQLATLGNIVQKHQIPVIYCNGFTIKKDEHESITDSPYGGKITDYWTGMEIRIERTAVSSKRRFVVTKNGKNLAIPATWSWTLSELGFI